MENLSTTRTVSSKMVPLIGFLLRLKKSFASFEPAEYTITFIVYEDGEADNLLREWMDMLVDAPISSVSYTWWDILLGRTLPEYSMTTPYKVDTKTLLGLWPSRRYMEFPSNLVSWDFTYDARLERYRPCRSRV